jgi:hypothetical protein
VVKSSEIAGELLDFEEVSSSTAWRLDMNGRGLPSGDHLVEGVVETARDASQRCNAPLDKERLFNWHAALFPFGERRVW